MSSSTKNCPRCGRPAHAGEGLSGHQAAHVGTHQLLHGSPLGAVVAGGMWALGKLLPKEYRCDSCGHKFNA